MDAVVMAIVPGKSKGRYYVDILLDQQQQRLTAFIDEDRIGDQVVLVAGSDTGFKRAFGSHQLLHGDVLKLVLSVHMGENIALPMALSDGPDDQ